MKKPVAFVELATPSQPGIRNSIRLATCDIKSVDDPPGGGGAVVTMVYGQTITVVDSAARVKTLIASAVPVPHKQEDAPPSPRVRLTTSRDPRGGTSSVILATCDIKSVGPGPGGQTVVTMVYDQEFMVLETVEEARGLIAKAK